MKKLICIIMALVMVLGMGATAFAEELPNAEVSILKPFVLTAEEHEYMCWPGGAGDDTLDRPLQVVMNFKANDTYEQAHAGKYGKYVCDFDLEFSGLATGSVVADGCYLAGNYGTFGWIVIPVDGLEVEEGISYGVVSAYDANLTYENICDYVKDFTASIYISDAVLEANPDFTVSLSLKMTSPDGSEVITVGEPAVYSAEDLKAGNLYIKDVEAKKEEINEIIEEKETVDVAAENVESVKEALENQGIVVTDDEISAGEIVIDIALEEVELNENKEVSLISFDVTPLFCANGAEIELHTFAKPVTFKLPVSGNISADKARVYHEDELIGTFDIKTDANGEKYVEVSSETFSVYTVEPIFETQPAPVPEKEPVRETVTVVIGEDKEETGDAEETAKEDEEQNPSTGAPVMMPVLAVAAFGAAVLSKRK